MKIQCLRFKTKTNHTRWDLLICCRPDSKRKGCTTWSHSSRNYLKLFRGKYDFKSGQNISELWVNFQQPDVHTIGVLKGEETVWGGKGYRQIFFLCVFIFFWVMWRQWPFFFSNLMKIINSHVPESQWTSRTRNMDHTKVHINQIASNQWFLKDLKALRQGGETYYKQRSSDKNDRKLLIDNNGNQKMVKQCL